MFIVWPVVIVKSKMDAIFYIYYKNNDVILNTKQIKACYNILWLNTVSNALACNLICRTTYSIFSFPINKCCLWYYSSRA